MIYLFHMTELKNCLQIWLNLKEMVAFVHQYWRVVCSLLDLLIILTTIPLLWIHCMAQPYLYYSFQCTTSWEPTGIQYVSVQTFPVFRKGSSSFAPTRINYTSFGRTNEGRINVDAHILRQNKAGWKWCQKMVLKKEELDSNDFMFGQQIMPTGNQLKEYCHILLLCHYSQSQQTLQQP